MSTRPSIFAGIEISSGRKPYTLALLNRDLSILMLQQCAPIDLLSALGSHEQIILGLHRPRLSTRSTRSRSQAWLDMLDGHLTQLEFRPFDDALSPRQTLDTEPAAFFQTLADHPLQLRSTLAGRLQRSLLLFDQDLRISDPMDFFEEITRHQLLKGQLPMQLLHSPSELDALASALNAMQIVLQTDQVSSKNHSN